MLQWAERNSFCTVENVKKKECDTLRSDTLWVDDYTRFIMRHFFLALDNQSGKELDMHEEFSSIKFHWNHLDSRCLNPFEDKESAEKIFGYFNSQKQENVIFRRFQQRKWACGQRCWSLFWSSTISLNLLWRSVRLLDARNCMPGIPYLQKNGWLADFTGYTLRDKDSFYSPPQLCHTSWPGYQRISPKTRQMFLWIWSLKSFGATISTRKFRWSKYRLKNPSSMKTSRWSGGQFIDLR